MQNYKKYAKSFMDSAYLLWTNKIHCFITPTNHIARKFNLLLHIPYKGTYLIRLLKRIHTSFIQTEIYYEQMFLSRDFDGC